MAQLVSNGVTKEILRPGNNMERIQRGDTITVHCQGSLNSNPPRKFWSTKDPGQSAFTFQVGVGQVIAGWDEGCMTMCRGEVARLTIEGFKGYGANGFQAWGIPPNAELLFEIEILQIQRQR